MARRKSKKKSTVGIKATDAAKPEAEIKEEETSSETETEQQAAGEQKAVAKSKSKYKPTADIPDADISNVIAAAEKFKEGVVERVDITPEQYGHFLKHTADTRPIKMAHARRLYRRMENGKWSAEGPGNILFLLEDENGEVTGQIADGQHRCWAAYQAGMTSNGTLVMSVTKDALAYFDDNAARTGADAIYNYFASTDEPIDHKVAKHVKTACEVVETYVNELPEKPNSWPKVQMDNQDALEYLLDERMDIRRIAEDLVEINKDEDGKAKKALMPLGYLVALYYLAEQAGLDADTPIRQYLTGKNIGEGSALGILREFQIGKIGTGDVPQPREKAAMMINAINAFNNGITVKGIKELRWLPTDSRQEPGKFPLFDAPKASMPKAA